MADPPIAERVAVPFRGPGSGVGELSWGQADIWQAMVRQRNWLPMGGWKRLPPGTGIDEVVEDVSYVVSRYQPMRTRLRFTDGRPQQVLFATGETHVDVIDGDSCPEEDLDDLARRVQDWYQQTPYDFAGEWPLRVGVIRHHGVLTHHIAIMCHLVSDGIGADVIVREAVERPATPVSGMQPMEQARWQAGPAGRRQHAAAIRHWESVLRSVPPRRFPPTTERPEPRHWRGDFSSPALRLAVQALTARSNVDSTQVMLTVFALAMAHATGVNPVVLRPMVSNRFRPGLGDVVAMLAQWGLCSLDIAGLPFADALGAVGKVTMTAYKHAYYDPTEMAALVERIAAERGPGFEVGAYFNDRRRQTRHGFGGQPVPEPDDIEKALPRSDFRWTIKQHDPFEPLIVHVDDFGDTGDALNVVIFMDSHIISPAMGEGLPRAMEEIAAGAALAASGRLP
ncbi:MAG TPA: condensation domain-containing protein [Candidatus Limnocylindrales bacterium]|nr:condensation domain-containing protein [Candidatus Limnocylindrales bacterium]